MAAQFARLARGASAGPKGMRGVYLNATSVLHRQPSACGLPLAPSTPVTTLNLPFWAP